MRYPKRKLALFFAVQTLAIAVMILLPLANRQRFCPTLDACPQPSAASVILSVLLILGELGIIAAALRPDTRVWRSLLGFGACFLVAAFMCALVPGTLEPRYVWSILALWHVAIGLMLLVTGAAAAVSDLLARLRRPDHSLPEDQQSSAMWPLD
jgi:MFS family permease